MKKVGCPFLFLMVLCFPSAWAQQLLNTNVSAGMPLRSRNYVELKGSPYRLEDWSAGTVRQEDGQVSKHMLLRYDEVADQLTFQNEKGVEMSFLVPVTEFELNSKAPETKSLFRKGFTGERDVKPTAFFEVVHDGKHKLLKKNFKFIQESRAYNSAVVTRTASDRVKYYVGTGTELSEFKRDAKSMTMLFGENWPPVNVFIRENKLNPKKDEDLKQIFMFADQR
ncbi:hypothetical protein [Pedobacter yulinensis]|nr:hypothetical protein [Pedobacter yulinensis]